MSHLNRLKLCSRIVNVLLVGAVFVRLADGTALAAKAKPTAPVAVERIDATALARLETHNAILNRQGVTSLSALGALTISGIVVPQPGFVRAAFTKKSPSLPASTTARFAQQQVPAEEALKPSNMTTAPTTVQNARGLGGSGVGAVTAGRGKGTSVPAVKIIGESFVAPGQGRGGPGATTATATLPLFTAYWVANSINLPANTTIVIQPNVRFLVLIATTIT